MTRLYGEYAPSLLRFGLTLGATQEIAQDAVQEAFLRCFMARREAERIENPRSWLFRVMRNYILDELKSPAVRSRVDLEGASQSPDGGIDPESQYRRSEVFRALARRLTPRELECVRLRAEGLRYAEISEVLGIRCGTVGALLARAHAKVREMAAGTRPAAKGANPDTNLDHTGGGRFAS
jgi:RNA polymerase sigma-70 factor (ECF subfamily)